MRLAFRPRADAPAAAARLLSGESAREGDGENVPFGGERVHERGQQLCTLGGACAGLVCAC